MWHHGSVKGLGRRESGCCVSPGSQALCLRFGAVRHIRSFGVTAEPCRDCSCGGAMVGGI